MSFLKRLFSGGGDSGEQADAAETPQRRRNLANLAQPSTDAPIEEPKVLPKRRSPAKKKAPAAKSPEETVSLVMRRQVPIRFDEEPRSWLGGLPRLPEGVEWPYATKTKPMHFVAQVACADFPPELWGGLGPREGWLCLFVDFDAIDNQLDRKIAKVIHVPELGPEAEAPTKLYWARRQIFDAALPKKGKPVQRRHFRRWPIDLVTVDAITSEMTGEHLYGAPVKERMLTAHESYPGDRPRTWRGAYTVLAQLVDRYGAEDYAHNWKGNYGGLLDYPEPDASERNAVWMERREKIAASLSGGYHCPEFQAAQKVLDKEIYEERRKGWTQRAFKVLDEEIESSRKWIEDYREQLAAAEASGDERAAHDFRHQIDYHENKIKRQEQEAVTLKAFFDSYENEEALVAEFRRLGEAHLEWAAETRETLIALKQEAGKQDFDAPISAEEWQSIADRIDSMKSTYWRKTYDTNLVEKVEMGIHWSADDVVREETLDSYAASQATKDALDPDLVATLEPRMRYLESDHPHKLGGRIDSVYGDPLKPGHVLLFQLASDAAAGWICGDLGFVYVSIAASDLETGAFDKAKAWLEA